MESFNKANEDKESNNREQQPTKGESKVTFE